jgi:hypothetical protein
MAVEFRVLEKKYRANVDIEVRPSVRPYNPLYTSKHDLEFRESETQNLVFVLFLNDCQLL